LRQEEKVSFSNFGPSFQENLAKLILADRQFADQIKEVLDISFFEIKYLQAFTKLLYAYKDEYELHPTLNTMASFILTNEGANDEVINKQMKDFLVRAHTNHDVEGSEFIKNTALDFCKKQMLKKAIVRSVELLKTSSFDEISDVISSALKLGQDNNVGYEYIRDFEERFLVTARNPVSTGWLEMDRLTQGGLGTGEMGVAIAATGAGKSHLLVHLGAEALKNGLNVVHYTLELADTIIARRYDSCLTKVPLSSLNQRKDEVLEGIKDVEGSLIIKEYPTKSASTATIKNHLEKLKARDFKPDIILLDYADLLKSKKSYSEKRHELESVYEELRGIAKIFECPLWTCSQTNRTGYNAELVSPDAISEAFNKCFVADLIFTLSRTADDKVENTGRFFIAKNRFGPDGMVYQIDMDTSFVHIKMHGKSGTANTNKPITDQRTLLREKYDKYKEELAAKNKGEEKNDDPE